MELPSYEDLGEATDLSAVEVAWRAWADGWLKWPNMDVCYEWHWNSFQGEKHVENSTWFLGKNKICQILLGLEIAPLKFKSSPSEKKDGFGKKQSIPKNGSW